MHVPKAASTFKERGMDWSGKSTLERKQKHYFIFTNCILVDECEKPQVFAHLVSCIIWCSLVEGDEQLDRPNSQTCMCCIGGGGVCNKHSSLPFGPIQPSSSCTKELHMVHLTESANAKVPYILPLERSMGWYVWMKQRIISVC